MTGPASHSNGDDASRGRALLLSVVLALCGWAAPLGGQGVRVTEELALTGSASGALRAPGAPTSAATALLEEGRSPGLLFLASLALPGAGQAAQKQGHWVLYVALEAWSWARYLDARGRGHALAGDYRELARDVARRISVGDRPRGSFRYYEALTQFEASGAYDLNPDAAGLQPETDTETHNGSVWALAQSIFLPGGAGEPGSPAYERALSYYREHAFAPEFRWSWGANGLEQQVYSELIRDSDEAFREATSVLGIVLANHLLSGIDALVSARLGDTALEGARLRGGVEPTPGGARWNVSIHLPHPRR